MKEKGFTLIELLVVMVIMGVLFGLAVPQLAGRAEDARIQAVKADIFGGLGLAIDMYSIDMSRYPDSLKDLVVRPVEGAGWKGPYLKRGLTGDPWGMPYIYRYPGSWNPSHYDLYSFGPDKKDNTGDEITNQQVEI